MIPAGPFDRQGLLALVVRQFRISKDGVHGPNHWARVRKHALTEGRAGRIMRLP